MHVLVTGRADFIGSHLVDSLLRDDCEVTVEKARAFLGYRAEVSYPEGVNRFVDWYSSRRCFTA